jgi:methionyl-tRNA formyltransferase
MMRILFLGNNWVGFQVLKWLKEQNEQIIGLVMHPPEKRRYGEEIVKTAQLNFEHIFDGSELRQRDTLNAIKALQPDIGLSVLFGYILKPAFLGMFPMGVVNLHPAYLPYNQGAYPNIWSIVEGTPAGVTMHYIDPRIDTGDIIARRRVPIEPVDTGETLYRKSEKACVDLFKETWPAICSGAVSRIPQNRDEGTYHRTSDVQNVDYIDLDREYTARELIDIIRARTFPPYPGTYFIHRGRKVYLRLQLLYEEQIEGEER